MKDFLPHFFFLIKKEPVMKPLTRFAIPAAFLLAACGDDITEINANVGAIKSTDDLPACTEDIAGQTAFVKETHEFLGCDGKEWMALGANTVSVGDNVCTSTSLSDGTGFEIFCNGESIGTVRNGKDGADGKDGAPGAKGDDGAPGTNGTNGTNGKDGTSCAITGSTATSVTIACGTESFTMDLTGYADQPEVCDANVSAEDCATLDSAISLSGVSQKGPFVTGTDITAYELQNGRSLKQTGKTFGGKIERADGTFDIKTVKLNSAFAYIVADGFYRNEVTGENSSAAIKLRALTNLKGRSSANINLVTHLEYDRVQYLVTRKDSSVTKAKMAAEKELFAAFGINNSGFEGLAEDLNVLKEGKGNAALLAISVLLQGDRNESELTALLAALSVDLGDNGQWDNAKQRAQIADWAMKTDLNGGLPKIRANVEGWKLAESAAPAFEQHVTNFWMQELDVDKCDSSNAGALFAVKNKNSAYYAANDSAYTDGDNSLVRLICAASGNSYAWHLATDIEKDTAALAKDLPADTAVAGKINTGFVYVKDSVWRRGTVLDTALRASCVAANRGTTDSLIVKHEPVWYICDVGDDASVPFAWREATTAEADTAGFGTPDRDTARVGNVNKSLVYVYEDADGDGNAKWRYGTELDALPGLGACTKNNQSAVKGATTTGGDTLWYTCASDKIVLVNGEQVPYVWREAQNIEVDTNGLGHSHAVGDIAWGNVNKNLLYVYENNNWVASYNKTMDVLVGKGCVDGLNGVVRRGSDGVNYTCYVRNEVDKNWVQPYGIMLDTVGWAQAAPNGGWKNGDVRNGRVNSEITYVYQDTCWRYGSALDSIFAKNYVSQGGSACKNEGDTTGFKYVDGRYYVCTRQTVGDTVRKWVTAPDIYSATKDLRDHCKEFDQDYGYGDTLFSRVDPGKTYVCDNGSFREATYQEESEGRGCVNYIYDHIYKLKNGFKRCTRTGWVAAAEKEPAILRDTDGNTYRTVIIGNQHWMAENLNRSTKHGDYSEDILKDGVRYYNVYALKYYANDGRLCPFGWHVPDTSAWNALHEYADGTALKSTTGWSTYYGNGTNEFGFAAYPDGYYYTYGVKGVQGKGSSAEFWSSSTSRKGGLLMGTTSGISTYDDDESTRGYNYWPIRCIQDN
jgi:uncharacterized protein (TIGR02145 family)